MTNVAQKPQTELGAELPERLDLRSHDFVSGKIAELLRLFPEARTEGGKIDFKRLEHALGETVDVGRERYGMNWPGKADCFPTIQTPSMGTLRPCLEESVNFDTTENLIIEGDNLEVLKLLQKSYLGKVKMIYIDPPYNTGNDFIYPDNYSESLQTYLEYTAQVDNEGRKFGTNSEVDGRFHSKWMNMMFPRLYLARNLLREDGVIFISIDDTEIANLRKLCDEVFGEEQFVAQILWRKRSTPPNDKVIGANHDYILLYARNASEVSLALRHRGEEQLSRYKNPDNHSKGPWAAGDLMANVKGGRFVQSLHFAIRNPNTGEDHFPGENGNWRFSNETIQKLLANNEIYFGGEGKGRPKLKRFLCDIKEGMTWPTIWDFPPLNTSGSDEMRKIFGTATIFENPKPSGLLIEILKLGADPQCLVLDFFAGSGSTAHGIMELNKLDGGARRFVLIQLPEPCQPDSEASKAGFSNIAQLTRERVRRVAKTLNDNESDKIGQTPSDRAFRAFSLSESNFEAWDTRTAKDARSLEAQLQIHVEHIREGRTDNDLLYEILLKSGQPLTTRVENLTVVGKPVYSIANGELIVSLDQDLTLELMRAIAEKRPQRVVCLDAGFAGNDQLKVNAVQIFKSKGVGKFQTV